jgi:hypothetical protein
MSMQLFFLELTPRIGGQSSNAISATATNTLRHSKAARFEVCDATSGGTQSGPKKSSILLCWGWSFRPKTNASKSGLVEAASNELRVERLRKIP